MQGMRDAAGRNVSGMRVLCGNAGGGDKKQLSKKKMVKTGSYDGETGIS